MDLTRFAPHIILAGLVGAVAWAAVEFGWTGGLLFASVSLIIVGVNGLSSG